MTRYELMFAEYPLRDHERELALWELQGLLPGARVEHINQCGVLLNTGDTQAAQKLRRLAFFARFRNGGEWVSTAQSELESADGGSLSARNIRYFAHSLHEYKGRFYPQLCKALMNAVGGGHGRALDPFCGCGTLLLEAALNDSAAVGVDINPVGCMIARAKIASLLLSEKTADKMRAIFASDAPIKLSGSRDSKRDMDYMRRWFPANNLAQIVQLEDEMRVSFSDSALLFLRVVLSEILKPFSWQAPNEQRIRRRKDIPPDNVREFFRRRLFFHLDKIEKLRRVRKRTSLHVEARMGDARRLPVESNSADFTVTSPPYATALPYIDADRLSLFFFAFADRRMFGELERSSIGNREISLRGRKEWESRIIHAAADDDLPAEIIDFLSEVRSRNAQANVGFRRKNTAALLCKYFIDMRDSLLEMQRVLKPGGKAALVVGDNFTVAGGVRIDIPTARFVNLIAEQNEFKLIKTACSAPPPAYNIYAKNASKRETISILEKAS